MDHCPPTKCWTIIREPDARRLSDWGSFRFILYLRSPTKYWTIVRLSGLWFRLYLRSPTKCWTIIREPDARRLSDWVSFRFILYLRSPTKCWTIVRLSGLWFRLYLRSLKLSLDQCPINCMLGINYISALIKKKADNLPVLNP